ncbi:MAG TPA: ubiquinol-cytochrome C chaperone family protein [Stellaceae bacterium]|jgi:cytochrome b pre-mRNA-processing protein 3|nr:ubiquinol-cytochrome C chaperone family protein [Stellaceae bacterium]
MSLASLFRRNRHRDAAMRLYESIVEQAREPVFFTDFGVPDTFDGRFELVALHGFLVLNRLKALGPQTAELAQELFDVMFTDFDRSLREMGVGDLGVGRHIKTMAQGFYGRVGAYETGLLAADAAPLAEALRRNLYGTVSPEESHIDAMVAYLRRCAATVAAQPAAGLRAGKVFFGAPPGMP